MPNASTTSPGFLSAATPSRVPKTRTILQPSWVKALPERLRNRTRLVEGSQRFTALPTEGEFVLYWMRIAVRAHDNPALDVACELAKKLGLPIFVYHALSERYAYASDRHHTFILEGARDVQAEFEKLGVGYAFHLERTWVDPLTSAAPSNLVVARRNRTLVELCSQAKVVVAEEMPTAPMDDWLYALSEQSAAPVLSVDASCIVPMMSFSEPETRAFSFRQKALPIALREVRTEYSSARTTEECVAATGKDFRPNLPFVPADLKRVRIADLVAQCNIDHAIGPVPDSRGGSTAGYERLEAFAKQGFGAYASTRNNPLKDSTSRLSAYLHYGHISPFRFARTLLDHGNVQLVQHTEKLFDELLVWRELAWHFCFHRPHHQQVDVLPLWAKETLKAHEHDRRHKHFSWEELARGQTHHALWDACQVSLLRHGELHNNLRMTWGKGFPFFTKTVADALAISIDLNHRYALDGRDPASFGGLLWCLGLFDRPFSPEVPILGSVRPRPIDEQAKRLDVAAYQAFVSRSPYKRNTKVAVIGAGYSGISCARTLTDHGLEVQVFDKGRALGARVSQKKLPEGLFDHGGVSIQAPRDERYRKYFDSWKKRELIRLAHLHNNDGEMEEHWVSAPSPQAILGHLAEGQEICQQCEVVRIERDGPKFWLQIKPSYGDESTPRREGPFDRVVIAIPAPNAALLLEHSNLEAPTSLGHAPYKPGLVAMVLETMPADQTSKVDLYKNPHPFLHHALRVDALPGRPKQAGMHRWIASASDDFAAFHLNDDLDVFGEKLTEAFREIAPEKELRMVAAHRWRFCRPIHGLSLDCMVTSDEVLVAGDFFRSHPNASDMECAFLSGQAAAGHILRWTSRDGAAPRQEHLPAPSSEQQLLFDL